MKIYDEEREREVKKLEDERRKWMLDPLLKIERISQSAKLPSQGTAGSACCDISCTLENGQKVKSFNNESSNPDFTIIKDERLILLSGHRYLIPTGLKFQIPHQHVVKIYPRSGLSIKKGITLVNCTGIIDSDYREEVMIPVINLGPTASILSGERIAQFEMSPTYDYLIEEVFSVSESETRTGGFGSTGRI